MIPIFSFNLQKESECVYILKYLFKLPCTLLSTQWIKQNVAPLWACYHTPVKTCTLRYFFTSWVFWEATFSLWRISAELFLSSSMKLMIRMSRQIILSKSYSFERLALSSQEDPSLSLSLFSLRLLSPLHHYAFTNYCPAGKKTKKKQNTWSINCACWGHLNF